MAATVWLRNRADLLLSATGAALLASLLVWLGPPGTDLAAHVYQRTLFLEHGFVLWNNFWYSGRYSFVTYSVLYYPLAAVLGIKLLFEMLELSAGVFEEKLAVDHEEEPEEVEKQKNEIADDNILMSRQDVASVRCQEAQLF